MNCPKCNTLNEDNAAVCINCGELLDTEDEFAPALDKNARLEEIQMRRMKKKIRQRRKKIISICIALIAVAAAVAYGVSRLKNNIEDDPDSVVIVTPSVLPSETIEPTTLPEETLLPEPVITDAPVLEEPIVVVETIAPVVTKKPVATKKPVSASVTKPTVKPVVKDPFPAGTIAKAPVVQGNPINSQLAEVLAVETAQATGKTIAKIKIGGETYFAYANADAFSAGLPGIYSIEAVATEDVYYGLPVYNVTDIDVFSKDGYVIADSSARLLTEADLQGLSKAQLEIARNEIFARHGRAFKRADIQSFFESRTWYKQNENYNYVNDYANLSDIELANSKFILAHE